MIKFFVGALSAAAASLFGKSKRVSAEDSRKHPITAFIALAEPRLPPVEQVVAYMNTHWPGAGPYKSDQSDALRLSIKGPEDGDFYVAQVIDLPIPREELQYACTTSMGWPEGCGKLATMKAHLLVAAFNFSDNVERATFELSAFTQAVAASSGAIGIYLGEAETVWSPEQFSTGTLQSSVEDPPYLIWLGLKAQKEADGATTVVTRGMTAFGFKNIEIQKTKSDGNDSLIKVTDIAQYLFVNGDDLKDGDTIGATEDERIRITFGPSILDASEQVFVVHY